MKYWGVPENFPPGPPCIPFLGSIPFIKVSGILLVLLNVITFFQVRGKTQSLFQKVTDLNVEAGKKILQKEKKLGMMVMAITGSFFFVFAPQNVIRIVDPWAPVSNRTAHICTILLSFSVVVTDPIIYCFSNEKCRCEIISLLKACGLKVCDFFHLAYKRLEKISYGDHGSTITSNLTSQS